MRRVVLSLLTAALLGVGWGGCGSGAGVRWDEVGTVDTSAVDEASGLAPSRREDRLYWVHNDSGNRGLLIALTAEGREVGRVLPSGIGRKDDADWEDMASFELDGKPYLLIADVGDNPATRPRVVCYIIEEPVRGLLKRGEDVSVPLAWKVEVVYPDGARDCEAVAVDSEQRLIYFLSKRSTEPTVYSAPLDPAAGVVTLQAVGKVPHLPQPSSWQATIPAPRGKYYGQPTGLDFSSDGRFAAVLTYGNVAIFERKEKESWGVTLGRRPVVLSAHDIAQAEALCFERKNLNLRAMGEGLYPVFYRLRWKKPVSD